MPVPAAAARRWVEAAGGQVTSSEGVEVSPLVSYAGEGLEELCGGKAFASSYDMHLQAGAGACACRRHACRHALLALARPLPPCLLPRACVGSGQA